MTKQRYGNPRSILLLIAGALGLAVGTPAAGEEAHGGYAFDEVKIGMPVEKLPGFVCDKPKAGPDRSDRHCVKFTDSRCAGKPAKVGDLGVNAEPPPGCFFNSSSSSTYLDGTLMQTPRSYDPAKPWKVPLLNVSVRGTRSVPSKVYEIEYWFAEEAFTDTSPLVRALVTTFGQPSDKHADDIKWRVGDTKVHAEVLPHLHDRILIGDDTFERAERSKQEAADEQARKNGTPLATEVVAKPAGAPSDLMERETASVKRLCGIDLQVRSDASTASEAEWKAADPGGERMSSPDGMCAQVVGAIAAMCGTHLRLEADRISPWRPAVAKEVRTVSCVMRHPKPINDRVEGYDEFTKRHLSYARGVLTVELHPQLGNVDKNVRTILARALVNSPLAPKGIKVDPDTHRDNGDPCTNRSQCQSLVCQSGFCHACGPGYACASSDSCVGSGPKYCYSKAAMADFDARHRACQKSGLGQEAAHCTNGRECCSGTCDFWAGSGRCTAP
jgi:hypothetical protein